MLPPQEQEKLIAEQASCLKLVSLVVRSLSAFCLYRRRSRIDTHFSSFYSIAPCQNTTVSCLLKSSQPRRQYNGQLLKDVWFFFTCVMLIFSTSAFKYSNGFHANYINAVTLVCLFFGRPLKESKSLWHYFVHFFLLASCHSQCYCRRYCLVTFALEIHVTKSLLQKPYLCL